MSLLENSAVGPDTSSPVSGPTLAMKAAQISRHGLLPQPKSDFDGVAIMLMLQDDDASDLAPYAAVEQEDLHCTLLYLGDAREMEQSGISIISLRDALMPVASLDIPVEARLGGVTRFSGNKGNDPVVLSVDSKHVHTMRKRVIDALMKIGVEEASDHGFTPHLTLGYVKKDDPLPVKHWEARSVVFDRIRIGFGGKNVDLYLVDYDETKVRHVRDVAYWGMPYGTPIVAGVPTLSVEKAPASTEPKSYWKISKDMLSNGGVHRTRPVSATEFDELAAEGERRLTALRDAQSTPRGLYRNWAKLKQQAWESVQEEWGGTTIDAHTGKPIVGNPKKYAMTVKPPGEESVRIPIGSDEQTFMDAMEEARKKWRQELRYQQHYLGVFRDEDTGTIDFDPVLVVDDLTDVETIGAFTMNIGGAYNFADGNGYWPPYVEDSEQKIALTLLEDESNRTEYSLEDEAISKAVESPKIKFRQGKGDVDHKVWVTAPGVGDVGWIMWMHDTGKIDSLYVRDSHQRKGIATRLFKLANELSEQQGLAKPKHSDTVYDDGAAWIASLEEEKGDEHAGLQGTGAVAYASRESKGEGSLAERAARLAGQGRAGVELKVVRYVRTPAGAKKYGQPIGTIIVADGKTPLSNLRFIERDTALGITTIATESGDIFTVEKDGAGWWHASSEHTGHMASAEKEEELLVDLNQHDIAAVKAKKKKAAEYAQKKKSALAAGKKKAVIKKAANKPAEFDLTPHHDDGESSMKAVTNIMDVSEDADITDLTSRVDAGEAPDAIRLSHSLQATYNDELWITAEGSTTVYVQVHPGASYYWRVDNAYVTDSSESVKLKAIKQWSGHYIDDPDNKPMFNNGGNTKPGYKKKLPYAAYGKKKKTVKKIAAKKKQLAPKKQVRPEQPTVTLPAPPPVITQDGKAPFEKNIKLRVKDRGKTIPVNPLKDPAEDLLRKRTDDALFQTTSLSSQMKARVSTAVAARVAKAMPDDLADRLMSSEWADGASRLMAQNMRNIEEASDPADYYHQRSKDDFTENWGFSYDKWLGSDEKARDELFKTGLKYYINRSMEFSQSKEWVKQATIQEVYALFKTQTYISQWAGSSGDSHPLACAIQYKALEMFDMDDAYTDSLLFKGDSGDSWATPQSYLDREGGEIALFIKAVYDETQERLAELGIDEVPLYRGMNDEGKWRETMTDYGPLEDEEDRLRLYEELEVVAAEQDMKHHDKSFSVRVEHFRDAIRQHLRDEYDVTPDWANYFAEHATNGPSPASPGLWSFPVRTDPVELHSQPLSSWTTNFETTSTFGTTVFSMKVPASMVWSTAATGAGCLYEFELVLLGGLSPAQVVKV